MSSAAHDRPSTTSALWHDGTTVYFDDLVYAGQIVAVFRTEREAMKGEGWATDRRVVLRDGEWLLEEVETT